MATMIVTEYAEMATDKNGNVLPIAKEPAEASQTVTFTTSTATTNALSDKTYFVRIQTSIDAHVAFAASPTATASDARVTSSTASYFGVDPGVTLKVAAYDGTS